MLPFSTHQPRTQVQPRTAVSAPRALDATPVIRGLRARNAANGRPRPLAVTRRGMARLITRLDRRVP